MKTLELANGEAVVADFSKCRFLNPVFLLGSKLILADYAAKGITVTLHTACENRYFKDYR